VSDLLPGPALGPVPHLRPPRAETTFTQRAQRFAALAPGHPLEGYLSFLATLCRAQERLRAAAPQEAGPSLNAVVQARDLAPLVARLAVLMEPAGLPAAARESAARARALSGAVCIETVATYVEGAVSALDPAVTPFVLAALQVRLVPQAAALRPESVEASRGRCPACGGPPLCGAVRGDDPLRYVSCGLCACEWHVTRVTCVGCGSTAGIGYLEIEGPGAEEGVKAETCENCRAYLKLFYVEKRPHVVAYADDVATLGVDLLTGEEGYERLGAHPFLLPGSRD
jgi:FdhE protein